MKIKEGFQKLSAQDKNFKYSADGSEIDSTRKKFLKGVAGVATVVGLIWIVLYISREECPGIQPLTAFDIEPYKGTWHEMYRSKKIPFESGICNTAIYGDRDEDSVTVWNAELFGTKPNQTMNDIKGKAYCPDDKL